MIIIGYRNLLLPTLFNFSNGEEKTEMEMNGAKKRNEYLFFTVFRIPLFPFRWKKGLRKIENDLYLRSISTKGKILNWLLPVFRCMMIGIIVSTVIMVINLFQ